jgi:Mrp family chromosome partitioning ATPase
MSPANFEPADPLAQQFEVLKWRVLGALNGKGATPISVAFTSCAPSEGVTTVAANFSGALGGEGERKVLLVSAHLQDDKRPSTIKIKGSENDPVSSHGQEETGRRALAVPIWQDFRPYKNVDILQVCPTAEPSGRVRGMAKFTESLNQAKGRYDFLVLDCPPLDSPAGYEILTSCADAVILVIEAGKLRREVIQRTILQLEDMGQSILGVVLNKRKYPIPNVIYKML